MDHIIRKGKEELKSLSLVVENKVLYSLIFF